jgi:hypothetical protein
MRFILAFALILPVTAMGQFVSFWTENFGFGCNTGALATDYYNFNTGSWTITEMGPNAATANTWFISATENGNSAGQCGTGCGSDATLHVGAFNSFMGTDLGAAYFEGLDGFCDIVGCGATDKRIESGFVDCTIFVDNTISFLYMEGGNAQDNATLWYFDGTTWSLLSDLPKTPICDNGQGQWMTYSIDLPSSSNNNPNVRIGFRWQNNDDGQATDPSFAVDDISIAGELGEDATPPVLTCPSDTIIYTEDYCYYLGDFESLVEVVDNLDFFPAIVQTPIVASYVPPGPLNISITATDFSGNSSSCSLLLTVIDDDAPTIECPSSVLAEAPPGNTATEVFVDLPLVEDNCGDVTVTNSFNASESASGAYPFGTTDVVYTATDESGNTAQCSVEVTVNQSVANCCLGDLNCDGAISVADLLILISQFGCIVDGCFADLDDDSIVGVTDLQLFNSIYGSNCPQ